ncbi:MAG TPA: DUF1801 domain-containing protein [Gemmatimonadaceae bacterium]|nr:DUF1801 domain-containing protein [Gemmatimonadaceae bacterium]
MQDENAESIDDYIAAFPPKIRTRLNAMRRTIRKHAPEATEKISYRIPTFYLNGNLVHFAAFNHHVGFYPGAAGIAEFRDLLKDYESAKGSVQFPHDEPLPLEIVAQIVKFRVEQNRWKKVKKSVNKSTAKRASKSARKRSPESR